MHFQYNFHAEVATVTILTSRHRRSTQSYDRYVSLIRMRYNNRISIIRAIYSCECFTKLSFVLNDREGEQRKTRARSLCFGQLIQSCKTFTYIYVIRYNLYN